MAQLQGARLMEIRHMLGLKVGCVYKDQGLYGAVSRSVKGLCPLPHSCLLRSVASLPFFPPCTQISGPSPLKPCVSFAYFGFDEHLMGAIRKSEFTQPTPIQAQVKAQWALMGAVEP